ncbi:MAG: hypothetical protein ABSF94_14340 [Steroidobacteraceae bacterium]|jgi:hypothetical protein
MSGAVMRSIGVELQPFLYAQIGDDANGVPLSILSVLARQNIDPWEQAADWSRLPQTFATQELAALISALPPGPCARAAPDALAARLVALLPSRQRSQDSTPAAVCPGPAAPALISHPVITRQMQIIMFCVLFGLLGQWLFAEFEGSSRSNDVQAAHVSSSTGTTTAP